MEIPTNLDCPALLCSGAITTSGDARRAQPTDEQQCQADRLHH